MRTGVRLKSAMMSDSTITAAFKAARRGLFICLLPSRGCSVFFLFFLFFWLLFLFSFK
jgi:hypothetical protein